MTSEETIASLIKKVKRANLKICRIVTALEKYDEALKNREHEVIATHKFINSCRKQLNPDNQKDLS